MANDKPEKPASTGLQFDVDAVVAVANVNGVVTRTTLAQALHVDREDPALTDVIDRAVNGMRLRPVVDQHGAPQYQAVPSGTVGFEVLEYLRRQRLRRVAQDATDLAGDLALLAQKIKAGHTVHFSDFTNLARQVAELAAATAAVEMIDQVVNTTSTAWLHH